MTGEELIKTLEKFPALIEKEVQIEIEQGGISRVAKVTSIGYDLRSEKITITVTSAFGELQWER